MLDSMNGVRGWAALVVFFYHSIPLFYPVIATQKQDLARGFVDALIAKSPLYALLNGAFAVFIFFVLSGFVLSVQFFKNKARINIISAMLRRYFRLAIPIFSANLFILFCIYFNLFHENEMVKIGMLTDGLQKYNFTFNSYNIFQESFVKVFTERSTVMNLVLWTMQYELIGSYIVFLTIILFGTSKLRIAFYLFFMIFLGKLVGYYVIYYKCFMFGVILADIYVNFPKAKTPPKPFLFEIFYISIAIFGLFLGSMPIEIVDPSQYQSIMQKITRGVGFDGVYALGGCLVVSGVLFSNNLEKIFKSKISLFLGKISFCLYLIHIPVVFTFGYYIFSFLHHNNFRHNTAFFIYITLTMVAILIISYYFEKLIDKPFNSLARRWVGNILGMHRS
ncbi:MAG: acyltransferase [Magnetococcus sp. DMHC-1]|nr:acyltransferase [Magnetococcales bacterium]